MPFVHVSSHRIASRALGAALLAESTPHEPERKAAELLQQVLATKYDVCAVAIDVPALGTDPRVSDDGMLMVADCVWWPAYLLGGLARALGFDQVAAAISAEHGLRRVWVVGPPRVVHALRLTYALLTFWCAAEAAHRRGLIRNRVLLALAMAVIAAVADEERLWVRRGAVVLWGGREVSAEKKPLGEAGRQLAAFTQFVQDFFAEYLARGGELGALVAASMRKVAAPTGQVLLVSRGRSASP